MKRVFQPAFLLLEVMIALAVLMIFFVSFAKFQNHVLRSLNEAMIQTKMLNEKINKIERGEDETVDVVGDESFREQFAALLR